MDALGTRIVLDKARIVSLRARAALLESQVIELRREANEIERNLETARLGWRPPQEA